VPVARDCWLKNLQDGVIVLDNQLRVIDFNPAIKRLLFYPKMP